MNDNKAEQSSKLVCELVSIVADECKKALDEGEVSYGMKLLALQHKMLERAHCILTTDSPELKSPPPSAGKQEALADLAVKLGEWPTSLEVNQVTEGGRTIYSTPGWVWIITLSGVRLLELRTDIFIREEEWREAKEALDR